MTKEELEEIELDWYARVSGVWKRDDPFRYYGDDAYLDREKQEVLFVPDENRVLSDEERKKLEELVEDNPERFIEMPVPTHGEHHDIFSDFLKTIPKEIRSNCNPVSIGGFKEDLMNLFPEKSKDIWHQWLRYHDKALQERAEDWFEEHGYKVEWVG
ncbi:MAG: UPF0158 family protein [Candidatus Acetothermia bacterium]